MSKGIQCIGVSHIARRLAAALATGMSHHSTYNTQCSLVVPESAIQGTESKLAKYAVGAVVFLQKYISELHESK